MVPLNYNFIVTCVVPREVYNASPSSFYLDHAFSWHGTCTSCVIYCVPREAWSRHAYSSHTKDTHT